MKIHKNEKLLICNKHGITKFTLRGVKRERWICCACDYDMSKRYLKKLRLKALEYMGGKCSNCNYDKCISALDCHHTDPAQKDFTIFERAGLHNKKIVKKWEVVKNELEKCILLCKNCHYELHESLHYENLTEDINYNLGLHRKEIHRINYLIINNHSSAEVQFKKIIEKK